ncbi:MAG: DNA polymerase III subunit gamma/tau [Holosporales bacterium]|nr:DNA polymerase III subunit gamma/tau [Holosporales bacterium]
MFDPYLVISRKYRPKSMDDLKGQDLLVSSLRSCLDNKKVPHAFLFHGIRGVGKTTVARILARCLSCVGQDNLTDITSQPCGVCRSCIAIDRDQHMDIMEFDAASRTGVDDIREIIDSTQYAPVLGRYKIFIIDEVHMLSKSAFNALLKTLEEPPQHVKFIFATTEMHKIPETVLSRCMVFPLRPVSFDALSNYLIDIAKREGTTLDDGAARVICEESGGSVRDALSLLEQSMMLSDDDNIIASKSVLEMLGSVASSEIESLWNLILSSKTKESLAKIESFMKGGADPTILYKSLQNALYKLIVKRVNDGVGRHDNTSITNLLYLWQILLKQSENLKNAHFPEYVLNATVIILSITSSFQNIEEMMINNDNPNVIPSKSDKTNEVIDSILNKFPGSVASEVE